jgi:putative FmdB family regulatory protein
VHAVTPSQNDLRPSSAAGTAKERAKGSVRPGDTSLVRVAKAAKLARERVTPEVEAKLRLVPIYEYKCPNGHHFEVFQKMTEDPPEVCEVCGEGPVQRVLYPVAVHFKGSGFYSTDYGRGSRKPSKDGDKSSESSSKKGEKKDKDVKKVAES